MWHLETLWLPKQAFLLLSFEGRQISLRAVNRFVAGPGHCGHFQKETKIVLYSHILTSVGQASHLPSQTKTFLAPSEAFFELITWA